LILLRTERIRLGSLLALLAALPLLAALLLLTTLSLA